MNSSGYKPSILQKLIFMLLWILALAAMGAILGLVAEQGSAHGVAVGAIVGAGSGLLLALIWLL